jgi:hypothetical protein
MKGARDVLAASGHPLDGELEWGSVQEQTVKNVKEPLQFYSFPPKVLYAKLAQVRDLDPRIRPDRPHLPSRCRFCTSGPQPVQDSLQRQAGLEVFELNWHFPRATFEVTPSLPDPIVEAARSFF